MYRACTAVSEPSGPQTGTEPRLIGRSDATTRRRPEMRAHTKGKHKMGKRFAIVIGVAPAGVMALGAQTALAGGESVDSTPPDLQLSGPKKQHPQNASR